MAHHEHFGLIPIDIADAAVGVAAMLQKPKAFNGSLVGIIVCGGNLTSEQMQAWLRYESFLKHLSRSKLVAAASVDGEPDCSTASRLQQF